MHRGSPNKVVLLVHSRNRKVLNRHLAIPLLQIRPTARACRIRNFTKIPNSRSRPMTPVVNSAVGPMRHAVNPA